MEQVKFEVNCRGGWDIPNGSTIPPNWIIPAYSTIGERSSVGENTHIGRGCIIRANSHLHKGVIVGEGSIIKYGVTMHAEGKIKKDSIIMGLFTCGENCIIERNVQGVLIKSNKYGEGTTFWVTNTPVTVTYNQ